MSAPIENFNRWWAATYPPDWWYEKTGESLPAKWREAVRDFASEAYLAGYLQGRVAKREVYEVRIALAKGMGKADAMLAAIDWYTQIERAWPDCGGFKYDEATGIATVTEG